MRLAQKKIQRRFTRAVRRVGHGDFLHIPNTPRGRGYTDEFAPAFDPTALQQRQHGLEQGQLADEVDLVVGFGLVDGGGGRGRVVRGNAGVGDDDVYRVDVVRALQFRDGGPGVRRDGGVERED